MDGIVDFSSELSRVISNWAPQEIFALLAQSASQGPTGCVGFDYCGTVRIICSKVSHFPPNASDSQGKSVRIAWRIVVPADVACV